MHICQYCSISMNRCELMPVRNPNLIVVHCVNKQKTIMSSFSDIFFVRNLKCLSPPALLGVSCHISGINLPGSTGTSLTVAVQQHLLFWLLLKCLWIPLFPFLLNFEVLFQSSSLKLCRNFQLRNVKSKPSKAALINTTVCTKLSLPRKLSSRISQRWSFIALG